MIERIQNSLSDPSICDFDPTIRVLYGPGALDRLGNLVRELGGRRALLVTDSGIVAAGHAPKAEQSLAEASIEAIVFSDVEENPTTHHVEMGVCFARENRPIDFIVALGGGSVMDCAKGINFLFSNGGRMEDYCGFGKADKPMLPAIGVPTTAGTGSEAQSFAVIAQAETHQKMPCGDKKARFRAVILDPGLLTTLPREVAAVSGIDAISHAVESYVSTRKNAFSQMFSKEALQRLAANYAIVLNEQENVAAWSEMLLGAHFAGMAIENSMLGAAHACANPLTADYGIAHGVAVGLMLPHVLRFNAETINGDYDGLLKSAGMEAAASSSGARLAERIVELAETAKLPKRLRDCKVEENELPELACKAATQWTGRFNPRPVGEAEFRELYRRAF